MYLAVMVALMMSLANFMAHLPLEVRRYLQDGSVLADAVRCLGLPEHHMHYWRSKEDRQTHTREINDAIRQIINMRLTKFCWMGTCGPWLEETWMKMEAEADFDDFGPFVPIFVPWVKLWVRTMKSKAYWNILPKILDLIRPDFVYVTLCHNSAGIEGKDNYTRRIPPNLLVMSQGGKGHIPLLLWLRELHWRDYPIPDSYKYDAVFLGYAGNHWMRFEMKKAMVDILAPDRVFIGHRPNWTIYFNQSKFIMAPRGYGRNSFRIWETLQMGMVPIYIYTDFLWLPFYDSINWSSIAIIVHLSEMNETLRQLHDFPIERIKEMRLKIRSMWDSHFSIAATWRHIRGFLKYGFAGSDLRCAPYSPNNNGWGLP
jgi:hypothetical protein